MEPTEVLLPPCLLQPIPETGNITISHCPTEIKTSIACPWAKTPSPIAVSLSDVMSEQLATAIQEEEDNFVSQPDSTELVKDLSSYENAPDNNDDHLLAKMLQLELDKEPDSTAGDCADDYLMAKMLQLESDMEHDSILKLEESKFNGSSKVTVSFGKYLCLPDASYSSDEEDEYFLDQSAKNHWHNFDQAEKAFQAVGKSGVSCQGNITTTKHDTTVNERRNAEKLMKLSTPELPTGDGGRFDMRISNRVYNTLKKHSKAEARRRNRLHEKKDKSTSEKALDENTQLILYKLINSQVLDSVNGCVSTGKEACVYHAWSGSQAEPSSPEYALKIFKTTLNEFQSRSDYIKGDHRFRQKFKNQNPRKVIHMWAEKEMRNLMRMKEANIPCPKAIALRKHVLIMTFIGKEMVPAPKLKDVELPFEVMTLVFEQILEIMKALYTKCKLVHADFSEYNLLWYEDRIWVIDVSQAVSLSHPNALEFLLRDCSNISSFFEKKGVKALTTKELYYAICNEMPKGEEEALQD